MNIQTGKLYRTKCISEVSATKLANQTENKPRCHCDFAAMSVCGQIASWWCEREHERSMIRCI